MPQGQRKLGAGLAKKKGAANKHGKGGAVTKKGGRDRTPKKTVKLKNFQSQQEITKAINKQNEETAAGAADAAGGRLNVVRAAAKPAVGQHSKATRGNKTAALAAKATKNPFVL